MSERLSASQKLNRQLASELAISVDVQKVREELDFLQSVNKDGPPFFYQPHVIRNAIRRYQLFWIPFIINHSPTEEDDLKYSPPLDVHWVWHTHMLSPVAYKADLEGSCLHRVINHTPSSLSSLKQRRQLTNELWNQQFPDEPFWPPTMVDGTEEVFEPSFSYNILSAALRQQTFFYQVSLPHYRDEVFLRDSLERYKRYLYLKSKNQNEFLVPCYDMDIVWHTHQVCPNQYARETSTILGGDILPHDDSVNDRSPDSKLCRSQDTTQNIWKAAFGEDFGQPGCMFRGPPPEGKLLPVSQDYQNSLLLGRKYSISFLRFKWSPDDKLSDSQKCFQKLSQILNIENYKLILFVNFTRRNLKSEDAQNVTKRLKQYLINKQKSSSTSAVFAVEEESDDLTFELLENLSLNFEIEFLERNARTFLFQRSDKSKFWCSSRLPLEAEIFLSHIEPSASGSKDAITFSVPMTGKFRGILKVEVKVKPSELTPSWRSIAIDAGSYYDCVIPQDAENLWGPIPLPVLTEEMHSWEDSNNCKAVTHSLVDATDPSQTQKVLTVYLLHSLPMMMSAVQVFVGADKAVVAHLVGQDTIGRETGLSLDKELRYSPWRGMLIKDNDGDWGICAAAWKGMTPGKAGIPGNKYKRPVKGVPGKPGFFKMFFHNLRDGTSESFVLPQGFTTTSSRKYTFSVSNHQMRVDLDSGKIFLGPNLKDVVQHVCLAFATSLLYLMVLPRPADEKMSPKYDGTSAYRPMHLDVSSVLMLGYCGWSVRNAMPTNTTLRTSEACAAAGIGIGAGYYCYEASDGGGCGGCGGCVSGGGDGGGCGGCGGCGG